MNVCPKCQNDGFQATEDCPKPVENIGGKRYVHLSGDRGQTSYRRYACFNCGHHWITREEFDRPIYRQMDLTEGADAD